MTWQILILLSVFTYSVSVLLQRVLMKQDKSDPVAFSIIFSTLVAVVIALYGFAINDMSLPDLRLYWVRLLAMTVLYGVGGVSVYASLKHLEASKYTILYSSRGLFTIVISSIFLGEKLNVAQWVGALLVFVGIVLVVGKIKKLRFDRAEGYAFLAAFCFALGTVNDRVLLHSFSVYPYVCLAFLLPAIFVAAARPSSLKFIPVLFRKDTVWKLILLSSVYAASALLFFAGLQVTSNTSQVAAINTTSVVVIVLLSIVFLKERTDWLKKIIGAISSFAGLLLLR